MKNKKKDIMKYAGIFKDDDEWYEKMRLICRDRKKFKLRTFKI